jgi:hypothetical protein
MVEGTSALKMRMQQSTMLGDLLAALPVIRSPRTTFSCTAVYVVVHRGEEGLQLFALLLGKFCVTGFACRQEGLEGSLELQVFRLGRILVWILLGAMIFSGMAQRPSMTINMIAPITLLLLLLGILHHLGVCFTFSRCNILPALRFAIGLVPFGWLLVLA